MEGDDVLRAEGILVVEVVGAGSDGDTHELADTTDHSEFLRIRDVHDLHCRFHRQSHTPSLSAK